MSWRLYFYFLPFSRGKYNSYILATNICNYFPKHPCSNLSLTLAWVWEEGTHPCSQRRLGWEVGTYPYSHSHMRWEVHSSPLNFFDYLDSEFRKEKKKFSPEVGWRSTLARYEFLIITIYWLRISTKTSQKSMDA